MLLVAGFVVGFPSSHRSQAPPGNGLRLRLRLVLAAWSFWGGGASGQCVPRRSLGTRLKLRASERRRVCNQAQLDRCSTAFSIADITAARRLRPVARSDVDPADRATNRSRPRAHHAPRPRHRRHRFGRQRPRHGPAANAGSQRAGRAAMPRDRSGRHSARQGRSANSGGRPSRI